MRWSLSKAKILKAILSEYEGLYTLSPLSVTVRLVNGGHLLAHKSRRARLGFPQRLLSYPMTLHEQHFKMMHWALHVPEQHASLHWPQFVAEQGELAGGWDLASDQIVGKIWVRGDVFWDFYDVIFKQSSSFFATPGYYPNIFLWEQETNI